MGEGSIAPHATMKGNSKAKGCLEAITSPSPRTWRQRAESSAAYRLEWGDLEVSAQAEVVFTADEREVTLAIGLVAREGGTTVAERTWRATHARSAG